MGIPQVTESVALLLFDSYGTLFDMSSVADACVEIFEQKGKELSRLWRSKQLEYSWLLSLMEHYRDFSYVTELALLYACKTLALQLNAYGKRRLLSAFLELESFPEVGQALHDLSGFRRAILSNGTGNMLEALLKHNMLEGEFIAVLSVDEAEVYKPSPRAYALVEQRLKVSADQVLYVSGSAFDVNGAKSYGFRGCWVNRASAQWDGLGFLPDITVGDVRELVEILDA